MFIGLPGFNFLQSKWTADHRASFGVLQFIFASITSGPLLRPHKNTFPASLDTHTDSAADTAGVESGKSTSNYSRPKLRDIRWVQLCSWDMKDAILFNKKCLIYAVTARWKRLSGESLQLHLQSRNVYVAMFFRERLLPFNYIFIRTATHQTHDILRSTFSTDYERH